MGNTAPFYKVLARVLFKQAVVAKMMSTPSEVLNISRPYVREMLNITKLSRDPEAMALAYSCIADAHYLTGHYYKALHSYKRALEVVEDPVEELGMMRTCALAHAYLGQEDEFTRVKEGALRFIEEEARLHTDVICHAIEGLGRAEGILAKESALDTLYQARTYYEKLQNEVGRKPMRSIQLDRSELEILAHMGRLDKAYFERIGVEALARAKEHGFRRHELKVADLLQRHLG